MAAADGGGGLRMRATLESAESVIRELWGRHCAQLGSDFFFEIMATEDLSEGSTPGTSASGPAIPNLKALLKESLTEILKESPSLLQLPAETKHGE